MRYLGNKRRLLGDIHAAARRLGFERGVVCDLFAGSGAVSRSFRAAGSRVLGCDLMESSHVFQRIALELTRPPSFRGVREQLELPEVVAGGADPELRGQWTPARRVLAYLARVDGEAGLFTRQYSTPDAAGEGRGFFRPEIARRIDAAIATIRDWSAKEWIDDLERDFLTGCLIDAADRRANISGTYGAYLKKWQANTKGEFTLALPDVPAGPKGKAHLGDAREWLPKFEADLLYLDPPYNGRQYAANYHIFEALVRAVRTDDLDGFEATIYGKTGLIPWRDKASKLCSGRGTECRDAFREILLSTSIPRVVISYSEEGIITRRQFEEMLAEYAGVARSRLGKVLTEVSYPRFRSDADGRVSTTGATRNYKQLPGRKRDEVCEWLWHIEKRPVKR